LFTFWTQCYSCKIWLDIYYTEFLTLFRFAMLVNECRLEIQFKKVRKVRNINNMRRIYAQNGLYSIFKLTCFALLCICYALNWIALHCIPLHWIHPSGKYSALAKEPRFHDWNIGFGVLYLVVQMDIFMKSHSYTG
jgi:hypothetical protein